jgi:hypothetical protein
MLGMIALLSSEVQKQGIHWKRQELCIKQTDSSFGLLIKIHIHKSGSTMKLFKVTDFYLPEIINSGPQQ